MTFVMPAAAATALTVFAAIARNRSRVYGLPFSVNGPSTIVPVAVALAASLWLAIHGDGSIRKAVMLACVWTCAASDLQSGYVFDWVSLGAVAASLLCAAKAHAIAGAIVGSALGGGLALVVYAVTARAGLGLGDVKLAAAIGSGLGVPCSVEALRMAVFCAGSVALMLLIAKRAHRRTALRFAPFLAIGATYAAVICE